jgi:hypothetical protein
MRTRRDAELIEQARKRGGEKAAERVAWAIRTREIASISKRHAKRRAMISDDVDHAWPPTFVSRPLMRLTTR